MKKIILSIKNWIQNRFWSRHKTPSLPRMTPSRIAIIFSGLFIALLGGIMFRNQLTTFFAGSAGADPIAYWKFDEGQGGTI